MTDPLRICTVTGCTDYVYQRQRICLNHLNIKKKERKMRLINKKMAESGYIPKHPPKPFKRVRGADKKEFRALVKEAKSKKGHYVP